MSTDSITNADTGPVGPAWLARIGRRAWYAVGILLVLGAIGAVLVRASSIFVPFLLAIILGVLFAPVVDALNRLGVPRPAGAGLVMVAVIAVLGSVGWLLVRSVLTQLPVIESQLGSAFTAMQAWLVSLHVPEAALSSAVGTIKEQAAKLGTIAVSLVFNGLAGIAALLVGTFMAMYMFFFMLADAEKLTEWVGGHIGLREDVGRAIVGDSMLSLRQYFRGDAVVALFTSALTGIGLAVFHVPLVIPIMAVTFVAVFVPYIGAVVSSVFAVLIALGAGGPPMALAALGVVLVVQNGLQGIIVGWAIGGALRIHPLVVILATVLGGIFGGILGAVLGAPVAAIIVRAIARLKNMPAEEPVVVPATD